MEDKADDYEKELQAEKERQMKVAPDTYIGRAGAFHDWKTRQLRFLNLIEERLEAGRAYPRSLKNCRFYRELRAKFDKMQARSNDYFTFSGTYSMVLYFLLGWAYACDVSIEDIKLQVFGPDMSQKAKDNEQRT